MRFGMRDLVLRLSAGNPACQGQSCGGKSGCPQESKENENPCTSTNCHGRPMPAPALALAALRLQLRATLSP